jgi:hypothetical protein
MRYRLQALHGGAGPLALQWQFDFVGAPDVMSPFIVSSRRYVVRYAGHTITTPVTGSILIGRSSERRGWARRIDVYVG